MFAADSDVVVTWVSGRCERQVPASDEVQLARARGQGGGMRLLLSTRADGSHPEHHVQAAQQTDVVDSRWSRQSEPT
jgi:hypothetical protein